jgi:hypothetical protein
MISGFLTQIARIFTVALLLGGEAVATTLALAGPPEIVFDHRRDACETWDVPDIGARAFRTVDGTVTLIASHFVNRAMRGPDLDRVRQDCAVVFRGRQADAPDAFDDKGWIAAPWTTDGRTVFALIHNEYQGHLRPTVCPAGNYMACWGNAVTLARSMDGGRTFQGGGAENLVAALPYRYRGDFGRHQGLFGPSNIVERDGHFYAFLWSEGFEAQRRGACLMRTDRIDDPRSWRAFDGQGFTVSFVDPYRQAVGDPTRHVCAPVAPDRLVAPVLSIVRLSQNGRFVALMTMRGREVGRQERTAGVWWSESADLLNWSPPRLLLAGSTFSAFVCDGGAVLAYPSLLDPTSPSRNFDVLASRPYLYVTRVLPKDCKLGTRRDLIRFPIRITLD